MQRISTLLALIALTLTALVSAQAAYGDGRHRGNDGDDLVFVQTNELEGNRIVVFERQADGRLDRQGTYASGGRGGIAAPGTESDRLASQGSLVYDAGHRLLLAVNAGNDGRLQGFRINGNHLHPLRGSTLSLGLANTDPPNFLTSPGQVGFTPDGKKLLVTTKASKSTIEIFHVQSDGLSRTPVSNPSATSVPFAFTFDPAGRLVSGEAGTSSVTTYVVQGNGRLSGPQSLSDGQVALCWIVRAQGFYYVSSCLRGLPVCADGDRWHHGGVPHRGQRGLDPLGLDHRPATGHGGDRGHVAT